MWGVAGDTRKPGLLRQGVCVIAESAGFGRGSSSCFSSPRSFEKAVCLGERVLRYRGHFSYDFFFG